MTGAGNRWSEATREFRATVRWCAGAIGAAAATILSSASIAPLLTDRRPVGLAQALAFGGCLLALLVGCCVVIYQLLALLVPDEITLAQLPPALLDRIRADPSAYLIGDAASLEDFRARRRAYARAAADLRHWPSDVPLPGLAQLRAVQEGNARMYREHEQELIDLGEFVALQDRFRRYPWWLFSGLVLVVVGVVGIATQGVSPAGG